MNDHEHKYYLSGKTYTEFTYHSNYLEAADSVYGSQYVPLYIRAEYAILSCNCGDVIRKVVKDD